MLLPARPPGAFSGPPTPPPLMTAWRAVPRSGGVKNAHMSFIENPMTTAAEETPKHGEVDATGVGNVSTKLKPESHGVTFLYRLVIGQAHKSYGLNVARAAGLDEELIELAAKKSAGMRDR